MRKRYEPGGMLMGNGMVEGKAGDFIRSAGGFFSNIASNFVRNVTGGGQQQQAPPPPPPAASDNTALYLGLGAAAVLGLVLLKGGKKRK